LDHITVADYALGLLILGMRRLDRHLHQTGSPPDPQPWYFLGNLHGKTLVDSCVGIVGMGRIGKEVARRLTGFNTQIKYYSRNEKSDVDEHFNAQWCPLSDLFSESEAIILTCALTEATHHLIDRQPLSHDKPGMVLVNVARGEICENENILEALNHNRLGIYLTDSTDPEPLPKDHPLWYSVKCHIFPHMATNIGTADKKLQPLPYRPH
jgi:lactate dehydrogenase-like 2-hydroxyacid dehydrogenase